MASLFTLDRRSSRDHRTGRNSHAAKRELHGRGGGSRSRSRGRQGRPRGLKRSRDGPDGLPSGATQGAQGGGRGRGRDRGAPSTREPRGDGTLKRRRMVSRPQPRAHPPAERENNPNRLRQRQKQIDYGKNTIGYDHYIQQVPWGERDPSKKFTKHPMTPPIDQKCSKRSFDGQVRKWRTLLHKWDDCFPAEEVIQEAPSPVFDEEDDEQGSGREAAESGQGVEEQSAGPAVGGVAVADGYHCGVEDDDLDVDPVYDEDYEDEEVSKPAASTHGRDDPDELKDQLVKFATEELGDYEDLDDEDLLADL